MRITGAIMKEQGVKFAVILMNVGFPRNGEKEAQFRQQLATVEDFAGLPIVLAYRKQNGGLTFDGRGDIVEYLESLPLPAIPWFHYTIG